MERTQPRRGRSVAPVIGVALLVVIVVVLAAVSAVTFVSLGESGVDSAAVQGMGSFDFRQDGDTGNVTIQPDAVRSQPAATFHLRVNDRDVHQWNGHDPVELSCLIPGDSITVISVTDSGQSSIVQEYDFRSATVCPEMSFEERFKFARVGPDEDDMQRVEVGDDVAFGLSIDPDGPGPDNQHAWADHTLPDVGKISLANDWHYVQAYTEGRPVEGLEPPVWVFVLTDNVHWDGVPEGSGARGSGNYANWTDDPDSFGDPVEKTYDLESGPEGREVDLQDRVLDGDPATEPTNDIYVVFKPDCPKSTLKIVAQSGTYENAIYFNDEQIVENTADLGNDNTDIEPALTFDAPGVCQDD
ncbi:hypothetical protein LC1Hm_0604 [Halomicrobium sp. LC1Hm]|nr:hypothetical protein LC1Hm_0604 [Halomicrobium sp. LC1Hm]